jgi:hypothetical protein
MRLSLTKAAHAATSSDAWQEIRVRSGRDDKFVGLRKAVHRLEKLQFIQDKFVISTGAKRSGEICGLFLILTHPLGQMISVVYVRAEARTYQPVPACTYPPLSSALSFSAAC